MKEFELQEYSDQTFEGIELEGASCAGKTFTDCRFVRCRFNRLDLTGALLIDCSFDRSELSLPLVAGCGMRQVTFEASKLVGVDFTKCSVNLFGIAFKNCVLDTCNFSSLKLKKTAFVDCTIRDSRLIQSILTEADFSGSDLERTLFHQCDLEKASFLRAKNYSIDPMTSKVAGAKFSLPAAVSLLTSLGIKLE